MSNNYAHCFNRIDFVVIHTYSKLPWFKIFSIKIFWRNSKNVLPSDNKTNDSLNNVIIDDDNSGRTIITPNSKNNEFRGNSSSVDITFSNL